MLLDKFYLSSVFSSSGPHRKHIHFKNNAFPISYLNFNPKPPCPIEKKKLRRKTQDVLKNRNLISTESANSPSGVWFIIPINLANCEKSYESLFVFRL